MTDKAAMNPPTQNGYPLLEVASALQKTIRRGDEEQAMYWALELVPRFEQYLWRRLVVIVNEDIGLANPALLSLVPTQRAVYFEFREQGKDGTARLALANAILLMCRSPKSRLSDHFQCAVNQDRLHGQHREIPDYALDKHTGRGRNLKRGVAHWLDEGCQLHPESDVADPYAARAAAWWSRSDFQQTNYSQHRQKTPAPTETEAEANEHAQLELL